jgi:hypothetical protein
VKAVREHIGERFPGRDEDAVPWVGAITAEGEPVPAADDQPGVARPLASPAQVDRLIDLLRQSAPGADEERLLKLRAALIEDRT